ncbi:MAG: AMP-binding protein [Gammaproteobacteria bacterium]|nr:AMP-binding protein [Gammaproteobacteria bacterium]
MAEPTAADPPPRPDDTAERVLRAVQALVAEIRRREPRAERVSLDSSLDRDLGLDSLARVELFARLERDFNVALPEELLMHAETPRDLWRALAGARGRAAMPARAVVELAVGGAEDVPHAARTLIEALAWQAQAHPERVHVRFWHDDEHDDALRYRALWDGAAAAAAALQRRGLEPGETVAIMLPTGREYFLAFYGVLLAGGTPVPIYPPARLTQIEEHLRRHHLILSNCRAALLVAPPEAKGVARLLRLQVESLRGVVTPEELVAPAGPSAVPVGAEDVALLQYTSGSTGNPKGVVLTHANLLANIRAMGAAVQAGPHDVFVSWLPLYHDMGLIGAWLGSLYYGMPLVVMSPLTFLARPERWLWAIHRHRATLSGAPNFGYELCLKRIDDSAIQGLDLSSWRFAFNGAEPVSPDTLARFAERFARHGFRPEAMAPVYGLAECSVGLAFPPPGCGPAVDRIARATFVREGRAVPATGESGTLRVVACGRPLPGHDIRIVDAAGRELPERQEGRLQFRGPSATSGYYRNPEETRRLFDDGWLESGDLAYLAEGEVYLTGRTKDVVIHAGRNIYPQELEERVGDLPGVRKGCVAVFGARDAASGTERLVVLAETRATDDAERVPLRARVYALAADLLGTPPDEVVLVPPHTVPKTSSGKIRRAAARELYEHGPVGAAPRAVWWQVARLLAAAAAPELRRLRRAAAAALYAAYAWALFALAAPPAWLAVQAVPRAWRWPLLGRAGRMVFAALGIRVAVRGLENLPSAHAGILVANHASYLDGIVLTAVLPRPARFVAKAEFARHPLVGPFLRGLDAEFVERFDRQLGVADARHAARVALAGHTLLFFPEGTFTRRPGLQAFHLGAFVAAAETGLPVVPVALRGTRSILRDGSWFPRRGAVMLTIGAPLTPASTDWQAALKLRDAARDHILRHCGEPDLAGEAPRP